jgi:hypothetical protein
MQTLRRLNDRERYYGLTWRGWLALGFAGGLVYGAVRLSPLGVRPTITIAVLALAFGGALLHALSGQALGPGAHLLALVRYKLRPKRLELPERALRGGLVLAEAPRPAEPSPMGDLSVEGESE